LLIFRGVGGLLRPHTSLNALTITLITSAIYFMLIAASIMVWPKFVGLTSEDMVSFQYSLRKMWQR